jgi:predicted outer membrane lipoprotein
MAAVWLVALLLGSAFAIASGQGAKWKVLNAVIILGCMGLGLGLGYSLSLGRGNCGFVGGEGVELAMMFGIVGAMACGAEHVEREGANHRRRSGYACRLKRSMQHHLI